MQPLLSKNKIFSLIFAFALIIPALFLFSACGEKNYYYDEEGNTVETVKSYDEIKK